MAKKFNPADLKPCWHMRTLVSAWVDGRLTGVARWYTEWHLARCPQCQASLPFLRSLHARLLDLGTRSKAEMAAERWERVEEAWRQADQEAPAPPPP